MKPLFRNGLAGAAFCMTLLALSPVDAKDALVIGSTFSTTGPVSFLGDPESKALQMCVKQINDEGGIKGRPVKLIWYDDGGDAKKAVANVRRLIYDDKIHVSVGGSTTGSTMAFIPILEEAEIPHVSTSGGTVITTPPKKWIFASPYTDRLVVQGLYADMQKRGFKKVGLISGPGGFDQSCRDSAKATAGQAGLEVVADELHSKGDTDMTAQFTNIRNSGADAVLYCGFGTPTAIVARNHRQLGIEQPLYMTHGAASKQFIEGAEGAAEGVRVGASAVLAADQLPKDHPQKEISEKFIEAYTSTYGGEISLFAANGYDACLIVKDAVARADTTDSAAIRDAIEQTKGLKATHGVFTMSPENHLGLDPSHLTIFEVRGGDWTIVE